LAGGLAVAAVSASDDGLAVAFVSVFASDVAFSARAAASISATDISAGFFLGDAAGLLGWAGAVSAMTGSSAAGALGSAAAAGWGAAGVSDGGGAALLSPLSMRRQAARISSTDIFLLSAIPVARLRCARLN
jgi:hypothetical protein